MQSRTKILKLIASVELFVGFILLLVTAFLYFMGEKFFGNIGESTLLILLIIGGIFIIDYPVLNYVARRIEEKNLQSMGN